MNKSGASKTILVLGLAVVVLLAAYLLAWRPRASQLSNVEGDRDALEQELAGLEAANLAGRAPVTDDPAAAALAAAIPEGPELPNLLRQLSIIATETGVDQTTLTPSSLTANTGVPGATILITIGASGSRSSAVEYVRRLGALAWIFVVDRVSLNTAASADPATDPASAPTGVVEVEVTGRVFTTSTASGAPA